MRQLVKVALFTFSLTLTNWLTFCSGQTNTVAVDNSLRSVVGDHYHSYMQQLGSLHHSYLYPNVHERSSEV